MPKWGLLRLNGFNGLVVSAKLLTILKDIFQNWFLILFLPLCQRYSPADSSRFGSSGNLSQSSSQLSETGQESAGGSELEESYHSYHSTGLHPSSTGRPLRASGHLAANGQSTDGEREVCELPPDTLRGLKNGAPPEKRSLKLQR